MADKCEHDWRLNPFIMLPSYPPKRQIVCIDCGETKAVHSYRKRPSPDPWDKTTWPKVTEFF